MRKPQRPNASGASGASGASSGMQWSLRDRSQVGHAGLGGHEPVGREAGVCDPQAMIDEFSKSLKDSGLNAEQQQELSEEFAHAMQQAAENPGAAPPLQRSDWIEAVDLLQQMGAVDEAQGIELVRKLDQAMAPLQKRNVQLALEFGRRVEEQGEVAALAWFKEQSVEAEQSQDVANAPSLATDARLPGGNVITQSRSRRLRGPPAT